MADTLISITAASVIPSSSASISQGTVGASTTVVAGNVLYKHTDGTLLLALNDTAVHAAVVGIALNGGGAGQVIRYATSDPALALGTTTAALAVGDELYLSDTAGRITKTRGDLASSEFVTTLGVCTNATGGIVNFAITKAGAAIA